MERSLIKKLPIRAALFLSYLLIIMTITVTGSLIFYYNSVNSSIRQTNQYTFSMLNAVNKRVETLIARQVDLAFYLSNDTDLKYYLRKFPKEVLLNQVETEGRIKEIINSYLWDKPEIFNVNAFVSNIQYVGYWHNSIYPLEEVKNSDWFKKLDGVNAVLLDCHKLTRSRLNADIEKADWYMTTTLTRIMDNGNQDLGYLAVDLSSDYLYNNLLNGNKVTSGSEIFIVNNQGIVISSENTREIGKKMKFSSIDNIVKIRAGGYKNAGYEGRNVLAVYTDANSQGWRIVEFIPASELYTGLGKLQMLALIIVIISALIALPLSSYLSGYITRPVISLASIMSKFRVANIEEKVNTDFTNEIGELHLGYNTMLDRIDKLICDIKESNEQKRQSDIRALQAQINPHFLYNTLDSISWNALNRNAPDISDTVVMLSMFFRLSLNKGRSICNVQDETELLKYYMDIQKKCFNSCFEYCFEIMEETRGLYIPKLILQPLVENSIVHGFERKKDAGMIIIKSYIQADTLCLEVEDNGKGIDEAFMPFIISTDSKRIGFGVKNVNERIKVICGEEYGLKYLKSTSGGTLVKASLPIVADTDRYENY